MQENAAFKIIFIYNFQKKKLTFDPWFVKHLNIFRTQVKFDKYQ